MEIFKTRLMKRIAMGKMMGLVFGLAGFFLMPLVFTEADIILRIALLFWYITLGAIVGVFGTWNDMPIFKFTIPYWFRGIIIGAWMNFVLALFMFDNLNVLMIGSIIEGCSPFWIMVEGAIFGLVVDFITTKYIGEGKELMK